MTTPAQINPLPAASTVAEVLDASPSNPPLETPTNVPETSSTIPTPEPEAEKISPKLQMLIQREKIAVERERAAKAQELSISERVHELDRREAQVKEFETIKKTNPLKALEMLGLSYQELTEVTLADGKVTPEIRIKQLEEKINDSQKAREDERRQQLEIQKKQEEQKNAQVISEFQEEIGKYLKDNSTRYELIAFEQQEEMVYGVIDEHYTRTLKMAQARAKENGEDESECRGDVMTIAQAADKVEEHLEKKYLKARDLSKMKAFIQPKPVLQALEKQKKVFSHQPKTLNNNLSATPAAPRKSPRTDEERIRDAIAYARNLRSAA